MSRPGRDRLVAAFRADSSVRIGSGHVMRCLTLADELKRRGWRCHFLTRDFPGALVGQIGAAGHEVHLLAAPPGPPLADEGHSGWLGVTLENDAAECGGVLESLGPDLVVVDHYAITAGWERAARRFARHMMVIDDLADRDHDCDLLLDQTLGRTVADYDGLVPADAQVLTGARHALLRPQFAARRAASLAARAGRKPANLLIAVGGHDPDNITERVLRALSQRPPDWLRCVSVILGSGAPGLEAVQEEAATMPVAVNVLTDVTDMASLMADADAAIGGAGTSSWERCAMGLPTLLVVLADNQKMIAASLEAAGAAAILDTTDDARLPGRLTDALAAFGDDALRDAMSRQAAAVADGLGTARVCDAVVAIGLSVRRATAADARAVLDWRNAVPDVRFYRSAIRPSMQDHMRWFDRALDDRAMVLLMVEDRGGEVGHIRFDRSADDAASASVSVSLAPDRRGQRLAAPAVLAALDFGAAQGIGHVLAEVHRDNLASVRLFEGLGFSETGQSGEFRQYAISLADRLKGGHSG